MPPEGDIPHLEPGTEHLQEDYSELSVDTVTDTVNKVLQRMEKPGKSSRGRGGGRGRGARNGE